MYEFKYHRPGTVRQAANFLAKNEDAKVIAGGHTLIPVMKQRLASPPHQPGEALDLRLALAYLHWWHGDKDEAVAEMAAACELAPGDARVRVLADLGLPGTGEGNGRHGHSGRSWF